MSVQNNGKMRLIGKNDAINDGYCERGCKALLNGRMNRKKLRIAAYNQAVIGHAGFRLRFFSAKFQVK
ncbi:MULTISPECIES: hypothetical protein [unclassified Serratia (in: enterobacteria)]|uniref:hypothetical protein n=1 Tax=unclassified Serratia (in: enterobacteria) TaxID=2647522 RepID=UPI002ED3982D|nr:hypothetical protein [Serratia sp. C2(2)]MEE4446067.1 hypothetical protein [Serratia sp. C2(1)]